MPRARAKQPKSVETLTHEEARRRNLPSAEHQPLMHEEEQSPVQVAYERRNRDLDPQLVWRGKDALDAQDLVVNAPPLYIQERVHPKVLVDDLVRSTQELSANHSSLDTQADMFADFNGLPSEDAKTEFYQHDANWSNRMILGDSVQVMASLAEREGLRGKVQCIYIDPPYGIKFNSNFQWSTTSRDVKDGNSAHITRDPEQVKAFRDTWRDGIHSYLTYLRDRLTVARDLLTESGSVFVQIGDENVHRLRSLMDEIFGEGNFHAQIAVRKASPLGGAGLVGANDYLLWYNKNRSTAKFRRIFRKLDAQGDRYYNIVEVDDGQRRSITSEEFANLRLLPNGARLITSSALVSSGLTPSCVFSVEFESKKYEPSLGRSWRTNPTGMERLRFAHRLISTGNTLRYVAYFDDFPYATFDNSWVDTGGGAIVGQKIYIVQTPSKILERCILMTTDPGDLVLDPTCGSGTTAYVSEQWGRRWITIDTSRVALALARGRIMGARYPYYLLSDSQEGQVKEGEIERKAPSESPTYGDIRQGFVYERVPHVTLRDIANNSEIDVIWEDAQKELEPLREDLNRELGESWEEWEIPREAEDTWPEEAKNLHAQWWERRISRQKEIDASIAAKADHEYLYDKPYEDRNKVRVAGPFTVESISPHRVLGVDEHGDIVAEPSNVYGSEYDFVDVILDNLRTSGVQQAHREDRIEFSSLTPWPGRLVCAEGRYEGVASGQLSVESGEVTTNHRRAAIFIGPEFGTVSRPDLVEAAREAADGGFDVLIACAFNYEAHTTEFESLGRVPVLKARMNADLHMAEDLKNTGKGNLFVIFGEPDIEVASEEWLVDSSGNRIAPYDVFKLVSGLDSLAEVNGLDRDDLLAYTELSCRREVWDYLADATRGVLDTRQHSGRTGKADDWGISPVAWNCAGLPGGTRDLPDLMRKAGAGVQRGFRELVDGLRRDKQNAQRADEVTLHSPLTTGHLTQVTVRGVDVFHPNTGEVRSDGPEGIACWFIDTDYNEEAFFVRHAYFLGASDPYKSLKTTLKAEINADAWATLHSDTSRPFDKPASGRIAVKVINHLGDEVLKVFRVE